MSAQFAIFSGVIRIQPMAAELETPRETYILNPYPPKVFVPATTARKIGRAFFRFLDGERVQIAGILDGKTVRHAHLAPDDTQIEDFRIAPEGQDPFDGDVKQYLRKDSREVAAKLNALGIRTVSAFYHRVRNHREVEIPIFSKYLDVTPKRMKEFLEALEQKPDNVALVRSATRFLVRGGVNLELLKRLNRRRSLPPGLRVRAQAGPSRPPAFPTAGRTLNLPSEVDLTPFVGPVKSQGIRATCVAHATAACLEAAIARRDHAPGRPPRKLDLSEQYLYWACKQIDGFPNDEGTLLKHGFDVMLKGVPAGSGRLPGGACAEAVWPYNDIPVRGNEAQGPMPEKVGKAFRGGKFHGAMEIKKLTETSIKTLKTALHEGHCIALSVFTYHFWEDDYTWREGVISLPLGERRDQAHAICLVGYRDADGNHADGDFIFKNSWDRTWGYGRPDPGFGSLPYRYILAEAIEAYALRA